MKNYPTGGENEGEGEGEKLLATTIWRAAALAGKIPGRLFMPGCGHRSDKMKLQDRLAERLQEMISPFQV
jgi:hypothetical protein